MNICIVYRRESGGIDDGLADPFLSWGCARVVDYYIGFDNLLHSRRDGGTMSSSYGTLVRVSNLLENATTCPRSVRGNASLVFLNKRGLSLPDKDQFSTINRLPDIYVSVSSLCMCPSHAPFWREGQPDINESVMVEQRLDEDSLNLRKL